MYFRKYFLMNADNGNQGGGNAGQTPQAAGTPPPAPSSEEAGFDPLDFYKQPAAPPPPAASNPPPAPPGESQPPAPPAQQEKTVTGYLDFNDTPPPAPPAPVVPPATPAPAATVVTPPPAPPAENPPPPAPPGEEPPAENPPPAEIDYSGLVTEGLSDADATALKDFAKANGLTKEAAQSFLDMKKTEISLVQKKAADAKTAHEAALKAKRSGWVANLKAEWAGEFTNNVNMVEKYTREFLPNINKELTTNGTMLPDYVMKDLYNVAKVAYATEVPPIHTNDNGVASEDYDPLDFYRQKK